MKMPIILHMNRDQLYTRLKTMPVAQLRDIGFQFGLPDEYIPSHASQVDAAIVLFRYAEGQPGGLTRLAELVQPSAGDVQSQDWTPLKIPYLSKLPESAQKLFGRSRDLQTLRDAWQQKGVLVLHAWGGVGKTTLVSRWLDELAAQDWNGATRVYAWSFYSQGAGEDRQVSADGFFAHALDWFGDVDPTAGTPDAKAERLAGLVQAQPTLLILDGLEPLQHPTGAQEGELKDKAMQVLLKALARATAALCVVATRLKIAAMPAAMRQMELAHLDLRAGARLLAHLGVRGSRRELLQTAHEYQGHALALNLLGRFLQVVHGGDIRKRDQVPRLTAEEKLGGHAWRVMAAYEAWLGNSTQTAQEAQRTQTFLSVINPLRLLRRSRPLRSFSQELAILYLLGLFDRPAAPGAIAALRAKPVIAGLTEPLQNLSAQRWQEALHHLRELGLLAADTTVLDTHPLVREYFSARLQDTKKEAFRSAHLRLYDYFKNLPTQETPDTLDDLEPLFQAVAHGCAAGEPQQALEEVYYPRIQRGDKFYTYRKLGAFGADLAAVAQFFEQTWSRPATGLSEDAKANVLSRAGFGLRALGRLREATEPMAAGLALQAGQKDWKNAASAAGNLSELWLTLGDVPQAVYYGRESVDYADRSGEWGQRMTKRTALADALHQAGDLDAAEQWFREAEAMHVERQPQFPLLYSLPGYRFCDLLLSRGEAAEVQRRVEQWYEWRQPGDPLLDMALEDLALGRAQGSLETLSRAVAGLREAGYQEYLTHGLLARAAAYRLNGDLAAAQRDLQEAQEIAERGGMKRWLTDCALEAACLALATRERALAAARLAEAERLVAETGYHRRDGELSVISEQLSTKLVL